MAADIVICEFFDEVALDQIGPEWRVLYDPDLITRPGDLRAAISSARALIVRSYTRVTGDLLDAGPDLRVVGRIGVGLDNIDLEACAARGITVCSAPGENARSVGEYSLAMALMLKRSAYQSQSELMAGNWPRSACIGHEISGLTMGIIGLGATGSATARRARAVGMSVVACDPYLAPDDPAWALAAPGGFDDVLERADVLSLHVPLSSETRHMIDERALRQMKHQAVLINAARGGVIDEEALVIALNNRRLAGAALDVFEEEPLTAERAEMFNGLPNLILTPHIAGVTAESNQRVSAVAVRNVLAVLEGTR